MLIVHFVKKHIISTTLVFIFCIYFIVGNNVQWGGDSYRNILQTDAVGYYSYLPAIFHHKDLSFSFVCSHPNHYIADAGDFVQGPSKFGVANKYYLGTAYFIAPFYFLQQL